MPYYYVNAVAMEAADGKYVCVAHRVKLTLFPFVTKFLL